MDEQEYIKGFNQGYLLKQHKPLLYETVSNGLVEDTQYRQGFRDGGKEYELENTEDKLRAYYQSKGNDKKKDRSR